MARAGNAFLLASLLALALIPGRSIGAGSSSPRAVAPRTDCNGNGIPDTQETTPTFGQSVLDAAAAGAQSVFAADLDGDGDLDVLSTSSWDNTVAWYENLDGAANYGPKQFIDTVLPWAAEALAVDVDADGKIDVVAAGRGYPVGIYWYRGTDGDGQFGPRQKINSVIDMYGARALATSDFDGDGDLDLAAAAFFTDNVVWYENTGGIPIYGAEHLVAHLNEPVALIAADLDGDGDRDILSASQKDGQVVWFRNIDGAGHFSGPILITGGLHAPRSVRAADLDGDADLDVLVASWSDDTVAWFRNLGSATSFGPKQVLSTLVAGPQSAVTADLDSDGDQDVAVASAGGSSGPGSESDCCVPSPAGATGCSDTQCYYNICWVDPFCCDVAWDQICADEAIADPDCSVGCGSAGRVTWFENLNGLGQFSAPRLVSTPSGAWDAFAADLDRDGSTDLLSAAFLADVVAVHVNRINDCNGNDLPDDCDIAQGLAPDCDLNHLPDACDIQGGAAADCNANGIPDHCDVRADSADCTGNLIPDECEADCDGNGSADSCDIAGGAADVDGNGVPDVCQPDCNGNGIPDALDIAQGAPDCDADQVPDVCEPDCDGNGIADACDTAVVFTAHPISTALVQPTAALAADLDGDGDLDAITYHSSTKESVWHENLDGAGTFGPPHLVAGSPAPFVVFTAHVDGDADVDLVWQSNYVVGWLSNDGQGDFGPPLTILDTTFVWDAAVADLDGDGDTDVVSSSSVANPAKIVLNRNLDPSGLAWSAEIIASPEDIGEIAAADIDGDGDVDVAFQDVYAVRWLENLGGTFGPPQLAATLDTGFGDIQLADMDGDGDADLLASASGTAVWFGNLDGAGDFGNPTVAAVVDYVRGMRPIDFDGDGDNDLLISYDKSSNPWTSAVAWVENLGGGAFGALRDIESGYAPRVAAADLDGDGDADALFALSSLGLFAWSENLGDDCDGNHQPDVCEPDCDADGLIDACDPVAADPADTAPLTLGRAGTTTTLGWGPPPGAGTAGLSYDTLRSTSPSDFVSAASCLEADQTDTTASDDAVPAPGAVFHYLIRVQNTCPGGNGNLGQASDGTPHTGLSCP